MFRCNIYLELHGGNHTGFFLKKNTTNYKQNTENKSCNCGAAPRRQDRWNRNLFQTLISVKKKKSFKKKRVQLMCSICAQSIHSREVARPLYGRKSTGKSLTISKQNIIRNKKPLKEITLHMKAQRKTDGNISLIEEKRNQEQCPCIFQPLWS